MFCAAQQWFLSVILRGLPLNLAPFWHPSFQGFLIASWHLSLSRGIKLLVLSTKATHFFLQTVDIVPGGSKRCPRWQRPSPTSACLLNIKASEFHVNLTSRNQESDQAHENCLSISWFLSFPKLFPLHMSMTHAESRFKGWHKKNASSTVDRSTSTTLHLCDPLARRHMHLEMSKCHSRSITQTAENERNQRETPST